MPFYNDLVPLNRKWLKNISLVKVKGSHVILVMLEIQCISKYSNCGFWVWTFDQVVSPEWQTVKFKRSSYGCWSGAWAISDTSVALRVMEIPKWLQRNPKSSGLGYEVSSFFFLCSILMNANILNFRLWTHHLK